MRRCLTFTSFLLILLSATYILQYLSSQYMSIQYLSTQYMSTQPLPVFSSHKRQYKMSTQPMLVYSSHRMKYMMRPQPLTASSSQKEQIMMHTQKASESSSHKLRPSSFNFIINEEGLCGSRHGAEIVLLVVVFLGANDTYEREFIRTTWGALAKTHSKIRLIFMLGASSKSSKTTQTLQHESSVYHDIIQCDFEDTYRKLVNKSFAVFQWTVRYCDDVHYVLKIDSDMRIDLSQLLSSLERPGVPDKLLCGETVYRAPFVVRNRKERFYISKDEYPLARYPDFCQGAAYIIPRRIVGRFAISSIPKTLFPMDDTYFTGILRKQLNEGLYEGFLSYRHHHQPTETRLKSGRYIMNVTTRGSNIQT